MTNQEALEKYRELAEAHGVCRAGNSMLDAWNSLREDFALHAECEAIELAYRRDAVRQWLAERRVLIRWLYEDRNRQWCAMMPAWNKAQAYEIQEMDDPARDGFLESYLLDGQWLNSHPDIFPDYDTAQIAAVEAVLKEAKT
jgi:hypothetical protein